MLACSLTEIATVVTEMSATSTAALLTSLLSTQLALGAANTGVCS